MFKYIFNAFSKIQPDQSGDDYRDAYLRLHSALSAEPTLIPIDWDLIEDDDGKLFSLWIEDRLFCEDVTPDEILCAVRTLPNALDS